ncbi:MULTISPECIES: transglycosylase SLT domain-containing protein [Vibrio]|uniref:transglycosylase SLT domain-containing protein n=1 Tax=Vibrio TaxID=662 RepID=UPI00078B7BAC|nr:MULTISPECIES: transglycosylase SLT domain-containing protein [Vibrio]BAU70806.1 hypothetical protein [Vibrio sp. 04Ya108]BBM67626.1 hypothetical protein VA249_42720 [Vibrio alfacsensis]BCN27108.1 hypothetical protein VYA_43000 [Vibrio alfacsensis]
MINKKCLTLAALIGCLSFQTHAATVSSPIESQKQYKMLSGLTSDDWIAMSEKTGIPIEVLYGLALRESGNYDKQTKSFTPTPNALAIGKDVRIGQKKHVGLFYLDDKEKVETLERLVNEGHTNLGIGLFQISYRYNKWRAERPVDLYNPKINSEAAAGVLLDCKARFKTLKRTLSCYRRGKVNDKGLAYSDEVMELSQKYGRKFARWVTGKPSTFTIPKPTTKQSAIAKNVTSYDKELSSLELLKKYYKQSKGSSGSNKRTISVINH